MNSYLFCTITAGIAAGLSLGLSACDKKPEATQPLSCVAADGSAIPCASGAAGNPRTDGAPEQQK